MSLIRGRKSVARRAALRRAVRAGLVFDEPGKVPPGHGPCRARGCEREAVCGCCRGCRVHCGCRRRIEVRRAR